MLSVSSAVRREYRHRYLTGHSPTLSPSRHYSPSPPVRRSIEDDGYLNSNSDARHRKNNSFLSSFLNRLKGETQPGTLILVRHGESEWNRQKRFTGWVDADLSERGRREIEHAARLLLERGYTVDVAYTSMLKRAIRSSWILLQELNQIYRPAIKSWRLNERMYGALEGVSKPDLASELGQEQVQIWRSGLLERPPHMNETHIHWHKKERKYADLDPSLIPTAESLQDTIDRTIPLWESEIKPDLMEGRNVMVVAHANSLRGIVKHIDGLNTEQIQKIGIPNGIPLVYKFDKNMKPIVQPKAVAPLSGEYLEKKGLLRAALEREEELAMRVDGYEMCHDPDRHYYSPATSQLLKSLTKLEHERQLQFLASQLEKDTDSCTLNTPSHHGRLASSLGGVSGVSGVGGLGGVGGIGGGGGVAGVSSLNGDPINILKGIDMSIDTNAVGGDEAERAVDALLVDAIIKEKITSPSVPHTSKHSRVRAHHDDVLKRPLIVIIRHGKTEHNKLGLFTGWEDAPLAVEGRNEALFAGQLLKAHGIQFDVVYTSWLSRAIETAWMVINELEDSLWVPIVKSWRLNERMYGALTGLSKKMIRQRHGVTKFLEWRRSFDVAPPAISSFSHAYPGNDDRYMNYVQDLPISVFETLIRSLAHGKLEIHHKFPKTESLKDCMERTIPYFKDVIVPQSINKGKSVLIASSENAIRGLLMHLCDIPIDRIHQVEIPTGLPLVYDSRTRRIRLLEDGGEGSPVDRYDFGASPELLLKPSVLTNGVYGKKTAKRKTGVLCEGKEGGGILGQIPDHHHEDDDEEDEDDGIAFYNPVILIGDKSLLNVLRHPKETKKH